jgi:hypothetical protein
LLGFRIGPTLTTPNTFEEISNEREALGWQNDPD